MIDGGVKRLRVIGQRDVAPQDDIPAGHEPTAIPADPIIPLPSHPTNGFTSTFPQPSIPPSVSGPSVLNQDHIRTNGIDVIEAKLEESRQPLLNGLTNGTNGVAETVGNEPAKHSQTIPAVPITSEAFARFGDVVQAWADPNGAPKGVRVTSANQGTAHKFHRLSRVQSSYPPSEAAISAISVFRSTQVGAAPGSSWDVKLLERHSFTHQTFIPMGSARLEKLGLDDGLVSAGRSYLVIVALNGEGSPVIRLCGSLMLMVYRS
jgi:ureidoglycolate hydrolase